MAKTLLEKMFFKPEYAVAALHVPKELNAALALPKNADTVLTKRYDFILAFITSKAQIESGIGRVEKSLAPNGLLWIAYPKAKALQTDLNRDILHAAMKAHGFDGVSLVALDGTWSAMRFKRL